MSNVSKAQRDVIKAIYDVINEDVLRELKSRKGGLRSAVEVARGSIYFSICISEKKLKRVNYRSLYALERKGLIVLVSDSSQRTAICTNAFKRTWYTKQVYETDYLVKLTKRGKDLVKALNSN